MTCDSPVRVNRVHPLDLIDCAPVRYTPRDTQVLHPISMALVINSGLVLVVIEEKLSQE